MLSERRLIRAEPSFGLLTKLLQINWLYVLLLCALSGVGYVALYSAGNGPQPYAAPDALRFAAGLVMMLCIALVDIRFLARFAWPLYGVALTLLVLVLRIGHVGKGAERWIDIAGMQVQPSELMKVALVMALASWFHKASWERMANPLFLIPPALAIVVPVALILKEPNLGTAVITGVVGGAVFDGGGVPLVDGSPHGAAGALRRPHRLRAPARLPAGPHHHLLQPRERPAGSRLQHHPVQDRAGLGRAVGRGVHAAARRTT